MERTWPRFLLLLFGNLLASILLSCLVWRYVLGRKHTLQGKYLDIDFFNTLGVAFTIIGLGIAIYQIAELRGRQTIIEQTTDEVKIQGFKFAALERYLAIRNQLEALQRRINSEGTFAEKALSKYADVLTYCINSLNTILESQRTLTGNPIIDCEKCVTLLSAIREDLYKTIEERAYASFKKRTFIANIDSALIIVSRHEASLKS
jgi:hypothetical protein